MCVIITSSGLNNRPTRRSIELCADANPHGSGLAWIGDRGRVEFIKGLETGEILHRLQCIKGPAIVHFRIASVGGVNPQLCHPFPITHRAALERYGAAKAVLFQNGTWLPYKQWLEHFQLRFPRREPVSDTRAAACLVARFGFDWLKKDPASRWAMLSKSGIRRLGHWQKFEGCHYSNLHWQRPSPPADYDWRQGSLDFNSEEES